MLLGPIRFHNVQKEVIGHLRERVPSNVFVGSQVPSVPRDKMIIVINAGGGPTGEAIRVVSLNLMIWGGSTWEACQDFALDVDALMRGLNDLMMTQILDVSTTIFPIPSGDGEKNEKPVYSSSYSVTVAGSNS